ncbi:hypothetical protein SKAU_G00135710 [Synaphobranchus kaupii]|uniref:Uncharacterized protein n=1 Tax=Synaphobranchus kaupii TaxID=118154 RepID=A0A9Q1FS18_SYNKA|nr:hypothetical protein SKAU_G00135710 [Synaphobranchus kaupii]
MRPRGGNTHLFNTPPPSFGRGAGTEQAGSRQGTSEIRKDIVGDQPLITEVISRWPALLHERQIRAEFRRIVTVDLLESFLEGLDGLVPRLLDVYKAATKSGKKQSLKDILDCLVGDAHAENLDEAMKGMQLGILIGYQGGEQAAIPHEIFSVAVVVEETIVLHNIKDVAHGFAMLMGVIYCVNLEYPDAMKYSFEFLQRVVMKVKPEQASARVHGLRNRILRYKL